VTELARAVGGWQAFGHMADRRPAKDFGVKEPVFPARPGRKHRGRPATTREKRKMPGFPVGTGTRKAAKARRYEREEKDAGLSGRNRNAEGSESPALRNARLAGGRDWRLRTRSERSLDEALKNVRPASLQR